MPNIFDLQEGTPPGNTYEKTDSRLGVAFGSCAEAEVHVGQRESHPSQHLLPAVGLRGSQVIFRNGIDGGREAKHDT